MLHSKLEKSLTALLVIVLLLAVAKHITQRFLIDSIATKRATIRRLENQLEQQTKESLRIRAAKAELASSMSAGLPNESHARVLYRKRLIRLLELAGLRQAIVTPLQSVPIESVGHIVSFSIQAECSSAEVARAIEVLERDQVANLISQVSVVRINERKKRLTMNVEAIAFNDLSLEHSVGPPKRDQVQFPLELTFIQNDPFSRGFNGLRPQESASELVATVQRAPKTDTVNPPPKPKVDARKFVRLVGLVEYEQEHFAWFYDSRSGAESYYRPLDTIRIGEWTARVIQTDNESLTLEEGRERRKVTLGATLAPGNS